MSEQVDDVDPAADPQDPSNLASKGAVCELWLQNASPPGSGGLVQRQSQDQFAKILRAGVADRWLYSGAGSTDNRWREPSGESWVVLAWPLEPGNRGTWLRSQGLPSRFGREDTDGATTPDLEARVAKFKQLQHSPDGSRQITPTSY